MELLDGNLLVIGDGCNSVVEFIDGKNVEVTERFTM